MTKGNIPAFMQAVVMSENGARVKTEKIPVPTPGPGEVLVKMFASPINPSDLMFIKGEYGLKKEFPVVPGFEGSGTVVESGKGFLPNLWKGKNVACAASPKYNGCWAEYMLTDANLCIPISKKIPLKQASMMFVNPMTALAFFDVYRKLPNPSRKQRAIINTAAASALGKMVIKLGEMYRIPVISIVRRDEQVKMLQSEGAENILNSSNTDFEDQLREISHSLNATVAFDAIGGNMTRQLLEAVPNESSIFVYGRLSPDECRILPGEFVFNGKQIRGFWLMDYLKDKSLIQNVKTTRKIQSLLGKELSSKINAEFPIERIGEALETYQNNMSKGKVLMRF